jgi:DNA-binding FadR family transcriptional regulator
VIEDQDEMAAVAPAGDPGPGAAQTRAADQIIAAIEARIYKGALADGTALPAERDLMAEFGASRTVVREAITALGARGLIEQRPRFRPVVRKPDYGTALRNVEAIVRHLLAERVGLLDLFETRIFLERALVREAALHARKEGIDALRTALEANRRAIPDSGAFYETDTAFHAVLYRIPGNPIYPTVHGAFRAWLAPHWDRMPRSPERNEMNFGSHNAIFEAIVARDPDAAEEALSRHLIAAWESVRATLGART